MSLKLTEKSMTLNQIKAPKVNNSIQKKVKWTRGNFKKVLRSVTKENSKRKQLKERLEKISASETKPEPIKKSTTKENIKLLLQTDAKDMKLLNQIMNKNVL